MAGDNVPWRTLQASPPALPSGTFGEQDTFSTSRLRVLTNPSPGTDDPSEPAWLGLRGLSRELIATAVPRRPQCLSGFYDREPAARCAANFMGRLCPTAPRLATKNSVAKSLYCPQTYPQRVVVGPSTINEKAWFRLPSHSWFVGIRNPHSDVGAPIEAHGREWSRATPDVHVALRAAMEKRVKVADAERVERSSVGERQLTTWHRAILNTPSDGFVLQQLGDAIGIKGYRCDGIATGGEAPQRPRRVHARERSPNPPPAAAKRASGLEACRRAQRRCRDSAAGAVIGRCRQSLAPLRGRTTASPRSTYGCARRESCGASGAPRSP